MPERALQIEQPKQVIVEGIDEVRVLGALQDHLGISDVQIHQCNGYRRIQEFLRTFIALDGFSGVEALAVVADANANRNGRGQSIQGTLANVGLPVPSEPLQAVSKNGIKVVYLIVPHETDGTMLEDVCLASVSDDSAMKCVDKYFECLMRKGVSTPRPVRMSKARVHAFLASRDDPALRIGEAADRGIWDFDSDAFRPMRELLQML